MNGHIVLWIYIVLLFLGGLMGFLKAKSKASIIASSIFAAILVLFVLDVFAFRYHLIVLIFLLLFFGSRLLRSKKLMPNGIMTLLTIIAIALTATLNP